VHRNGVTVRMELANHLPAVRADRIQLQQVVLNLVLNAAEAMRAIEGQPREVTIRTEHHAEGHVRLAVKDMGSGFDPAAAEQLFQAFFTTKPGGMGIGLSVSRSIIENHRGRLWATVNDDGPGATFWLSIPCVPRTARRPS
jgi:signal transduction histidine kinase